MNRVALQKQGVYESTIYNGNYCREIHCERNRLYAVFMGFENVYGMVLWRDCGANEKLLRRRKVVGVNESFPLGQSWMSRNKLEEQ